MPEIDVIKVVFEGEWRGQAAVNQIEGDLKRVSDAAVRIESAFRSANPGSTDFFSFGTGDTILKFRQLQQEAAAIRQNIQGIFSAVDSGALSKGAAASAIDNQIGRLNELEDAAKRGLGGFTAEAEKTASTTDRLGASIGDFVSKYRTLVFSITAIGASIAGTVAAIRKVYEFAEAGASVRQLSLSFDYFNENVSMTPNLLEDMREAARGTISDLSLMSSFLTLVAGTSQELASQFAKTAPQLLEIAKAANVLNPALGDTQFFFESLARGIKRGEIRLLDNLGIIVKVGDANKAYAQSIGVAVDALSAEQRQIALLNEVLRVGGNLIEQVGGSVDSLVDPYQRMSAAQENFTNALKTLISLNFEPNPEPLIEMADALARAAQEALAFESVLDGVIAQYQALDDVPAGLEQLGRYLGLERSEGFFNVRGVNQAKNAIKDLALSTAEGSQTVDEALNRIANAYEGLTIEQGGQSGTYVLSGELDGEKVNLVVTLDEIIAAIGDFSSQYESVWEGVRKSKRGPGAIQQQAEEIETASKGLVQSVAELVRVNKALSQIADDFGGKSGGRIDPDRFANSLKDYAKNLTEAKEVAVKAAQELAEAQREIAEAINADISGPVVEFATGDGTSDLIVGNIKNLGEAWVTTTNATEDQRYALERWKEEASGLAEKIRDLELGIGTYGSETEKVSEQLADARGELEFYRSKIAEVEGQLTSTTEKVNRGIQFDDGAIGKGLIEALEGVGASSGVIAATAQEFGLLSAEAADAALKIGFVKAAIGILAGDLTSGAIDPATARGVIEQLVSDIEAGLSLEEIEAQVNVRVTTRSIAASQVRQDIAAIEGLSDTEITPGINTSPVDQGLQRIFGAIDSAENIINVTADTGAADDAVDDFIKRTESKNPVIKVQITYNDPGPPGAAGGGGGGGSSNNGNSGGGGGGGGGGAVASYYTGPDEVPQVIINPPSTDLGGGAGEEINLSITVNNFGREPDTGDDGTYTGKVSGWYAMNQELARRGLKI